MIAKCGCDCPECRLFQKECSGCPELEGKVFWTQFIGEDICPIFKCCEDKAYASCGECEILPCKKWYDLKDPALSEEEHLHSIHKRVNTLKNGE